MITLVVLFTNRVAIETVSFALTKISIFLFCFRWFSSSWFCCSHYRCAWLCCRLRCRSSWGFSCWWFWLITLNISGPVTILELWIKEQSIRTRFDVSLLMRTFIELVAIRMSIYSIILVRTEFSFRWARCWLRSWGFSCGRLFKIKLAWIESQTLTLTDWQS